MVRYSLHLFAGGGGGIIADRFHGIRCVGAVEIEDYARRVLLARQLDGSMPAFPVWDDITTFRYDNPACTGYFERLQAVAGELVVCGGFPCQDISCAGRGEGIQGERSGLWKEFARIIGEVGPRYAFLENSPAIVNRGLGTVLADLAALGYDAEWGCVSAEDVGARHLRDRWWCLARRRNDRDADGDDVGAFGAVCGGTDNEPG